MGQKKVDVLDRNYANIIMEMSGKPMTTKILTGNLNRKLNETITPQAYSQKIKPLVSARILRVVRRARHKQIYYQVNFYNVFRCIRDIIFTEVPHSEQIMQECNYFRIHNRKPKTKRDLEGTVIQVSKLIMHCAGTKRLLRSFLLQCKPVKVDELTIRNLLTYFVIGMGSKRLPKREDHVRFLIAMCREYIIKKESNQFIQTAKTLPLR